jgi:hypothetical protein
MCRIRAAGRSQITACWPGPQGSLCVRDLAAIDSYLCEDILVLQCHLHRDEPSDLNALRDAGYQGLIVGWFWDHPHGQERNRGVADLVDVAVAAHDVHARLPC